MNEEKKTIPSISIEAQELIKRMLEAEVGDIIPYDELNELCMGDVRNGKAWALNTARRNVLRDYQMVFQVVRGVGIKRANDGEIIDEAGQGLTRIHRRIGRDMQKLMAVAEYDKLPPAKKVQFNARISQLGALYLITKTSTAKRIEGRVLEADKKLSLPETLEIFKKG